MRELTVPIANEENTFNINDLWVSSAVAQDTAVFDDEDETENDDEGEDLDATPVQSPAPTPGSDRGERASLQSSLAHRGSRNRNLSGGMALARSIPGHRLSVSQGGRRFSSSSGQVPSIFANTGLAMQPAIALPHDDSQYITSPGSASADPFFPPQNERRTAPIGGLSVIAERPAPSHINLDESSPLISPTIEMTEKPTTYWKSLPLSIIVQVSNTWKSQRLIRSSMACLPCMALRMTSSSCHSS